MVKMKPETSFRATAIGDVVGSRSAADRAAVHRDLSTALRAVAPEALDAPAFTVGDEFQGSYSTVGQAIAAMFAIRLAVAPAVDVRFGIGWGEVTVLDPTAGIQDGPGWWAARAAIEWTAETQRQSGFGHIRTCYRTDDPRGAAPDAINAALICRDFMLGSLDERSIRILRGLVSRRSKKQLAADEGISPSAVSQRVGRDGLDVIVVAAQHLSEVT